MVPSSMMSKAWFLFSRMNKRNRAVISRGRLQKSLLCSGTRKRLPQVHAGERQSGKLPPVRWALHGPYLYGPPN
jgi:hypothetical protein